MSGTRKTTMASKLHVQRIRVNREGYDSSGTYWGAGQDVFIVTSPDGREEITVWARTITEAREKAEAELNGKTPAQDSARTRTRIGGHPTRVTRHVIDWSHPVTGESVRIRVTHARNYLVDGTDHVEIESIAPKRAALPITETGYVSHFIDAHQLMDAGGAKAFAEGWLARECRSKDWRKKDHARRQGDLFQWAEAQAEVGRKAAKPRTLQPKAAAHRRRSRDSTPS